MCLGSVIPEVQPTYPVTILDRSTLCTCQAQFGHVTLFGSYHNCSNKVDLQMYGTYNFVTEWLTQTEESFNVYKGSDLLTQPSDSYVPIIPYYTKDDTNIFLENKQSVVSVNKYKQLLEQMEMDAEIYFSKNDKEDFNEDDLENWFDEDKNYTMIYILWYPLFL